MSGAACGGVNIIDVEVNLVCPTVVCVVVGIVRVVCAAVVLFVMVTCDAVAFATIVCAAVAFVTVVCVTDVPFVIVDCRVVVAFLKDTDIIRVVAELSVVSTDTFVVSGFVDIILVVCFSVCGVDV